MYAATVDHAILRSRRPQPGWRGLVRRLMVGSASLGLLLFGLAHAVQGGSPSTYETITVRPGDTLWSIAQGRHPNADVREEIDRIEQANGLTGPAIRPGELLRVPAP